MQPQCGRTLRIRRILAVDFLDVVTGGLDRLATRHQSSIDTQKLRLNVFQRIDPVPAWRDPVNSAGLLDIRQIKRADSTAVSSQRCQIGRQS